MDLQLRYDVGFREVGKPAAPQLKSIADDVRWILDSFAPAFSKA